MCIIDNAVAARSLLAKPAKILTKSKDVQHILDHGHKYDAKNIMNL